MVDFDRGSYVFNGTDEHEEKRMHDSIKASHTERLVAFRGIGKGFSAASIEFYSFRGNPVALIEDLRGERPSSTPSAELQLDRQRNISLPFSPDMGGLWVL